MNTFIERNKKLISAFCILVLVAMTWVTTRASLESSVIDGFKRVAEDPWGLATLADAYFGFLFFYLYVLSQETRIGPRLLWLLGLLVLGNFAIAFFVLLQIRKMSSGKLQS